MVKNLFILLGVFAYCQFLCGQSVSNVWQGKWIGAKVGLFSTAPFGKDRGWVDADRFRIDK